ITTILTGVFVGIPAMFVDINEAIEFTNIGTLFAFVLVSVGVIVLRRTDPDRHRPFRCPGVPWLPLLSIVSCGVLMAYLPFITWMRFVVGQVVGGAPVFPYRPPATEGCRRAERRSWRGRALRAGDGCTAEAGRRAGPGLLRLFHHPRPGGLRAVAGAA